MKTVKKWMQFHCAASSSAVPLLFFTFSLFFLLLLLFPASPSCHRNSMTVKTSTQINDRTSLLIELTGILGNGVRWREGNETVITNLHHKWQRKRILKTGSPKQLLYLCSASSSSPRSDWPISHREESSSSSANGPSLPRRWTIRHCSLVLYLLETVRRWGDKMNCCSASSSLRR